MKPSGDIPMPPVKEPISDDEIIATVSYSVQIGEDEWMMRRVSKVFGYCARIDDILDWAKEKSRQEKIGICDIVFSEVKA